MSAELKKLAKQLININSVSGNLSKSFDVKKQQISKNRFNIIAKKGRPVVILNIHMDTVPGYVGVREANGRLYGRGAVDAKGPMAAMILAGERAAKEGLKNFWLVFDAGEETDLSGIKKVLAEIPKADLIIIGEPTNMKLRVAQKGILEFKVKVKGKAAHSSMPEKGECAITKLMDIISRLKKIKPSEDGLLGRTTMNIGLIKGGTASNVVPDYAEAVISYRMVKGDEGLLERVKQCANDDNVTIELMSDYGPYCFDNEKILNELKQILDNEGIKTDVVARPGFTVAFFMSAKGPAIVIGPGDGDKSHSSDENIIIKSLEDGYRFYYAALKRFC
jgi:acetylornithine deacetylase/succinyl-diaminopimelate desuccinylase-like protein